MKLILEPLIHKIKFETNSYNEDISVTILRDEALRWACLLDNRNCVTTAIAKTIRLIVNDFETYRYQLLFFFYLFSYFLHVRYLINCLAKIFNIQEICCIKCYLTHWRIGAV